MTSFGVSALFLRPHMVDGTRYMLRNLLHGMSRCLLAPDSMLVFQNPGVVLDIALESVHADSIRFESVEYSRVANRFVREYVLFRNQGAAIEVMLLPNYFTPPFTRDRRTVTVIHDLQHKHLPENFSRRKRLWLDATMRYTLGHSATTVAVSEFVRSDLLNHFGHQYAPNIVTIPNPISWNRFAPHAEEEPSTAAQRRPETQILTVASHYPHKNLTTLLKAFKVVATKRVGTKLVLAGQVSRNLKGLNLSVDIDGEIRRLHLGERVEITGHISDEQLAQHYRMATLAVFPSLSEGFGMPAVEALGLGVPVLTTRCGALEEVTFGKAQYLENPLDHFEMAERMMEMIDNPEIFKPPVELTTRLRQAYDPVTIGNTYLRLMRQVATK